MNFLQTLINFIQSLLGGAKQPTTPTDTSMEERCTLHNIEIPADQDLASLPLYEPSTEAQGAMDFSAQALDVSCNIQIRPNLGFVNVRGGPRLAFGVIARTVGGSTFRLQGASEKDPDGYRWYMITTPTGAGWVRGDMVIVGEDCLVHTFITEDDLTPPDPIIEIPTNRFPLPANVPITQGYTSNHRAYDMAMDMGTPIASASPGLIIRKIDCETCAERSHPNIFPCAGAILLDPKWGYGYGNFVIIRHDYRIMPPSMRQHMDDNGLRDGFVYILYAHFSETRVSFGDVVGQGVTLGLSGNHGCSSAPHLHFEVRMGRDETVDGRWLNQTPVNPNLIFIE